MCRLGGGGSFGRIFAFHWRLLLIYYDPSVGIRQKGGVRATHTAMVSSLKPISYPDVLEHHPRHKLLRL